MDDTIKKATLNYISMRKNKKLNLQSMLNYLTI